MIEIVESLKVRFGEGANSSALVKLELDDALNLDTAGNVVTSFKPGTDIFFRLHHDSTVQLGRMAATDFKVVSQGSGQRYLEEQPLWIETADIHELGHLPTGQLSVKFFGNLATGLKRSGLRNVVISGGILPSLCQVGFYADYSLFCLKTRKFYLPADESYPVTIVAYMEAA